MTQLIDVERELDRWFADGPNDVADRVIVAALLEIDLTPQRSAGLGAPWRTLTMKLSQPLVAAAAIVVAVGIVGAIVLGLGAGPSVGAPSPSPAASAAAPAASVPAPAGSPVDTSTWVPYTSARYGYSISHPNDWTVIPGTSPSVYGADEPGSTSDEFRAPAPSKRSFYLSSQALPAGMTGQAWIDQMITDNAVNPGECFPPRSTWPSVTIDGQAAAVHGGLEKCDFTEAVAVVGGRVYTLHGTANRDVVDLTVFPRDLFDAFLTTVHFDPKTANDAAGSTATLAPTSAVAPLTTTFHSPLYGYAARIGSGWAATPGTVAWTGYDDSAPMADSFAVAGSDTTFSGSSRPLELGQTWGGWLQKYNAVSASGIPSGCGPGDPSTWTPVTIGGRQGLRFHLCNAEGAVVQVGDRGYSFGNGNTTFDASQHAPNGTFEAFLAAITFDPATAPDEPKASPSP